MLSTHKNGSVVSMRSNDNNGLFWSLQFRRNLTGAMVHQWILLKHMLASYSFSSNRDA